MRQLWALTTGDGDGPHLFVANDHEDATAKATAWLRKGYEDGVADLKKRWPGADPRSFEDYYGLGDAFGAGKSWLNVEPIFGAKVDDIEDTQNGWFRVVLAVEAI